MFCHSMCQVIRTSEILIPLTKFILLEELLRKKFNSHTNSESQRNKFTRKEYESLVKKAEIFGKRASVIRTNKHGRYRNLKFLCINSAEHCVILSFSRREIIDAMVVPAREIATNPAFSLLKDRGGKTNGLQVC